MKDVDEATKRLARYSLIWYGGGLACGIVLAVFLVANTIRTILYPVRAATESAVAIGAGNLDQVVPITSDDELGQLAAAFNTMARQLREFRQIAQGPIDPRQQTSQATIDSFPEPVLVVDPERPRGDGQSGRPPPVRPAAPGACRRMRRPSGSRPKPCGSPWPTPCTNSATTCPRASTRSSSCSRANSPIRICRGSCRSAMPSSATLGAAVLLEDMTRFRLLDEVKSNMVATVSHELKTPLTSIRLVLHLLLQEDVGPLLPKQLELLVDARDNAERLLAMINNLLGPGPAGARRQPAPLAAGVARDLAARRRSMPSSRGPQTGAWSSCWTTRALPQQVPVDKEQLQHALQNLLDNALAHTPTGGRITLAAEAAERPRRLLGGTDTGSRHSGRVSAFDFPEALPRAGRRRPRAAAAWGWRSSARSSPPTAARRLRKQARREDRVPHVAAGQDRPTDRKLEQA